MPIPSHAPIPIASTNYARRQGLSPSQLTPPATHNLSALAACRQRPHQIAIGATGTGNTTRVLLLTTLLARLYSLIGVLNRYSNRRHGKPLPSRITSVRSAAVSDPCCWRLVLAHRQCSVVLPALSGYGASVPCRIMLIATRVAEEGWPWKSSGAVTRQIYKVTSLFS